MGSVKKVCDLIRYGEFQPHPVAKELTGLAGVISAESFVRMIKIQFRGANETVPVDFIGKGA